MTKLFQEFNFSANEQAVVSAITAEAGQEAIDTAIDDCSQLERDRLRDWLIEYNFSVPSRLYRRIGSNG